MKDRLCPICGGRAFFVPYKDHGAYLGICSRDGCRQVIGRNQKETHKLWNERRFTDPDPATVLHGKEQPQPTHS